MSIAPKSALPSTRARWLAGTAGAVALAATALVGSTQMSAVAAPAPEVFAGFDNSDLLSGTSPRTNTVNVPAGAYAITAKAFVRNGAAATDVDCRLQAGGSFDDSTVTVSGTNAAALALNVVHNAASPTAIVLTCKNLSAGGDTQMSFIKIVATRVNGVSDVSM